MKNNSLSKKNKVRKFLFYHAIAMFLAGLFVLITAYNYSNENHRVQFSPPWPEQIPEASSFSQSILIGGIAVFIILLMAFVAIFFYFSKYD